MATMQGYYDSHPLLTLDRPLFLAGLVAADTRFIGQRLAALTGLGYTDLERRVEHRAGKSVWELVFTEGSERFCALENEALDEILADRPHGVVSLGDGTLVDPRNRRRILDQTLLVTLERDLPNCYWRFQALRERLPEEHWHPFYPGRLETIEQVRPFYEERQPGLAAAHHTIPLGGEKLGRVVDRLMELLPAA